MSVNGQDGNPRPAAAKQRNQGSQGQCSLAQRAPGDVLHSRPQWGRHDRLPRVCPGGRDFQRGRIRVDARDTARLPVDTVYLFTLQAFPPVICHRPQRRSPSASQCVYTPQ